MTWSHFTAYLDGERPLTTAERDELLDNFAALLAGDCAAAGYTLNEDDLAAVKASGLQTDRACLDGPAALHLCARLHDLLEAASSAFTNYDDAVATALDDEGITEEERDDILESQLDAAHLWNYYKRLLDALTCSDCSAPAFEFEQRTATCARYGFAGFTDESKWFRTCVSRGIGYPYSIGSALGLANVVGQYPRGYCANPVLTDDLVVDGAIEYFDGACLSADTLHPPDPDCSLGTEAVSGPFFANDGDFPDNVTARATLNDFYGPDNRPSPRGVDKLLNEITEAEFIAEGAAAARLATWETSTGNGLYGGYVTAYQRKIGNIVALETRHIRLRAKFRVPASGGYRLKWKLWSQPRTWDGAEWVEGVPTLVADQSYEWDGETPGGYDAGDADTWPVSPWFELPEPALDGAYFITDLVGECAEVPSPTAPDGFELVA